MAKNSPKKTNRTNQDELDNGQKRSVITSNLKEHAPDITDKLSSNDIKRIAQILSGNLTLKQQKSVTQTQTFHQGPLPPAHEFEKYEQIQPGMADRIMGMAEKEQNYGHERDRKIIDGTFVLKKRAQLFAFILSIIFIIGGFIMIFQNEKTPGYILSGIGLVSLVSQFLGSAFSKKEKPPPQESQE